MAKDKAPLSEVLRARFSGKGLSLAAAAREIGISDGYLRQMLARNRYPRYELKELTKLAEIEGSLEGHYDFEVVADRKRSSAKRKRSLPTERFYDDITEPEYAQMGAKERQVEYFWQHFLRGAGQRFPLEVSSSFAEMEHGDKFYYWSITEYPFEFSPKNRARNDLPNEASVRDAIAGALAEGAEFYYFYPSTKFVENLAGFLGQQFENRDFGYSIPWYTRWEDQFSAYRNDMISELLRREQQKRSEEGLSMTYSDEESIEKMVKDRLRIVPVDSSPFISPFTKYVIYKDHSSGEPWGFAQFPSGSRNGEVGSHLPLSPGATDALFNFFESALLSAPAKSDGDTSRDVSTLKNMMGSYS